MSTRLPGPESPRRLSVRTQLTLWNIGVVAVVLILFGAALRFGVQRVLIAAVDRDLTHRMDRALGGGGGRPPRQMGGGPDDGPGSPPGPPPPENGPGDGWPGPGGGGLMPPRPREPRDGMAPRLLGANGRVRGAPTSDADGPWSDAGFERAMTSRAPSFDDEIQADGRPIRVYSHPMPVFDEGVRSQGVMQVAAPTGDIRFAVDGVTFTLLLLIPVALILTGLGGALLAERALRPVDRLGEALDRIQAHDLRARLPVTGVDEFARLTAIVNGMLGRLESAFDRQKRFAADASHELRTPLATIKASTSLALEEDSGLETPEQFRGVLRRIDEASDRANRLVQDLLLLVRVGNLPVRAGPVDVFEVLSSARSAVLDHAAATGRVLPPVLIEAPPAGGMPIYTDRDHLLRLLVNLLENAARHTPLEGRVTLSARATYDGTELTIADTGSGIAPEHLARITEPFYRADADRSRKRGGAGLGLAIASGIAEALGGTLELTSQIGHGTTAVVTLPAASPRAR